jgi:hypothetical protein
MSYKPKNLKRWSTPSHYFGASWPNHYSAGVGQSRDSDCLERSNFVCMLEALGGESNVVTVVRESHWAVGWVEWIAIEADGTDTSNAALLVADDIQADLQDYPVINEDHWSELETEEANEVWHNCYSPQERIQYIREHKSQFEFHDYSDMLDCVRGNYFAGYASELIGR